MKSLRLILCLIFVLSFGLPSVFADTILQESLFNINGTLYHNTFVVPGLNATLFDTTTTGLGTLVLTYNPGSAGNYFVNAFFDHEAAVPFFNEYGTVNSIPAGGQTYQIDDPLYGTIYDNASALLANQLNNGNYITGTTDNFGGGCTDPSSGCNSDVSMALGFAFHLDAGFQELITLKVSTTAPVGGFYLQQTHPQDPNNGAEVDLYFSGNAISQPTGPNPIPEPSTLVLLGSGLVAILGGIRRRLR